MESNELYDRYTKAVQQAWLVKHNTEELINLSYEDIRILIELDTSLVQNIVEISQAIANLNDWLINKFYYSIARQHLDKIRQWEKSSLNFEFLASRVYFSEYYDFDIFNRLTYSPRATHRLLGIKFCNEDELLKLSEDADIRVRKEALIRLGYKALDRMLKDSRCEIREAGVIISPMEYPGLIEMKDDLSFKVVAHLVRKIDIKELPYILGNRNFKKNNRIRKIIEERMSINGAPHETTEKKDI